jgi:hypothetical protein
VHLFTGPLPVVGMAPKDVEACLRQEETVLAGARANLFSLSVLASESALANDIVDGSDMVSIESMPQAEHVG